MKKLSSNEGIKRGTPKIVILLLLARLAWERLQIDTDLLHIITSTADDLFGRTNIDDLEQPWNPKIRCFSDFFRILRCDTHLKIEFSLILLETGQDNLRMKLNWWSRASQISCTMKFLHWANLQSLYCLTSMFYGYCNTTRLQHVCDSALFSALDKLTELLFSCLQTIGIRITASDWQQVSVTGFTDLCSQDKCSQDKCSQDNWSPDKCSQHYLKYGQMLTKFIISFLYLF